MFLLSKTNSDWWNVRKSSGEEGFVPANYIRESEPQRIKVRVKKEVKVPEKRMVPRTRMVKKTVRTKKRKPKAPRKLIWCSGIYHERENGERVVRKACHGHLGYSVDGV